MALNFPDSPTLNQVYTDTTSGFSYQWDGVVWKSYTPSSSSQITILDDISGSFNGSTDNFSLTASGTSISPANSQQLRVVLGGIVQEPITDYYVAGSTIVFTTAPSSGLDCSIVSLGPAVPVDAPNSGNIFARQEYNPTGVQTTFTFTSNYTPGYFEVYQNGVKLVDGTDYTATNGTSFDLTVPAQNGDVVEGITYLQTTLYTLGDYATNLTVVNNASVGGILTATSFVGDGSGITGISSVSFATTSFGLSGTPNVTVGVATASSFVGNLTGNATGLSGTPNVTVGVVTATSVSVSGNVSIAGTLTYEDVTNVDSIGLVTARSGVVVVGGGVSVAAGGLRVTSGISTISGGLDLSNLLREGVNIVTGKLSNNSNINLDNGMVHFFTIIETTTSTPNITSSVGINTQMAVGETSAVTIITTAAAAGYSTCINIDGSYNDVKWLGGTDPSTGGTGGNDVYSLQIIKTASATYTVLGSVNNFA